jgi:hypothetical protein
VDERWRSETAAECTARARDAACSRCDHLRVLPEGRRRGVRSPMRGLGGPRTTPAKGMAGVRHVRCNGCARRSDRTRRRSPPLRTALRRSRRARRRPGPAEATHADLRASAPSCVHRAPGRLSSAARDAQPIADRSSGDARRWQANTTSPSPTARRSRGRVLCRERRAGSGPRPGRGASCDERHVAAHGAHRRVEHVSGSAVFRVSVDRAFMDSAVRKRVQIGPLTVRDVVPPRSPPSIPPLWGGYSQLEAPPRA